jgi:low affinity Fe/Cu permease
MRFAALPEPGFGACVVRRMKRPARKKAHGIQNLLPEAPRQGWFGAFAHEAARLTGKPAAFLLALLMIVVWASVGPVFGFSDTWQLIINTSTTIITFLMVFLIQTTQNRDTLALQAKLAEIILCMPKAPNSIADAEDMSEEELQAWHERLRRRARIKATKAKKRR